MGRNVSVDTPNKFDRLFEANIFCVALLNGRRDIAKTDILTFAYPLEKPYGYRWAVETEAEEVPALIERITAHGFIICRLHSIDADGKEWDNSMTFYRPRLAVVWQKYVEPHRHYVKAEALTS